MNRRTFLTMLTGAAAALVTRTASAFGLSAPRAVTAPKAPKTPQEFHDLIFSAGSDLRRCVAQCTHTGFGIHSGWEMQIRFRPLAGIAVGLRITAGRDTIDVSASYTAVTRVDGLHFSGLSPAQALHLVKCYANLREG